MKLTTWNSVCVCVFGFVVYCFCTLLARRQDPWDTVSFSLADTHTQTHTQTVGDFATLQVRSAMRWLRSIFPQAFFPIHWAACLPILAEWSSPRLRTLTRPSIASFGWAGCIFNNNKTPPSPPSFFFRSVSVHWVLRFTWRDQNRGRLFLMFLYMCVCVLVCDFGEDFCLGF